MGGPARFFTEALTDEQVIAAVDHARANNLRLFVLGGGSNLVVADAGWPGLVLKIGILGIEQRAEPGSVIFDVGAGEDWDAFVAKAVRQNCAGIETLSGIPGTVGGTPVQNVGAYGQEVSGTIVSVRALDLRTNQIVTLSNAECGFSYRTSIFSSSERGHYIVLRVTYALTPGGAAHVTYADLKHHFATHPNHPTLEATREAVRKIRLSKAMLIVPNDDDCRSAGSFFKNPIVSMTMAEDIAVKAKSRGIERDPPRYPAADGMVKLSAAWLVENSGFPKGYGTGPAGISRRHTLAIVNRGGAKAADIIALKDKVQAAVRQAFGIDLQPEPVFVGFDEE